MNFIKMIKWYQNDNFDVMINWILSKFESYYKEYVEFKGENQNVKENKLFNCICITSSVFEIYHAYFYIHITYENVYLVI